MWSFAPYVMKSIVEKLEKGKQSFEIVSNLLTVNPSNSLSAIKMRKILSNLCKRRTQNILFLQTTIKQQILKKIA